eukprot:CAMPEP_0119004480 /NCGR_PEP_ID=MMETSP1176-20130426/1160_1 /TAXON_ID=265551 /ORGANISM="Synedropsis recta cf, Strain CCMP1620" /LENGTH=753 /DNA_ID=CAMNT_0006956187 /DNA_START=121 /DNA_END=2382 /DNA_ORIENTATION=+
MLNTFEKTKAHEARRAAIQRQMEAMEAAATSRNPDSPGGGNNGVAAQTGTTRRRGGGNGVEPQAQGSLETARRFLWDEDEEDAAGTKPTGGMTGAKQGVKGDDRRNLYSNDPASSRTGAFSFIGNLFGGGKAAPARPAQTQRAAAGGEDTYRPSFLTSCYIFFRRFMLRLALAMGSCYTWTRTRWAMAMGNGRGRRLCLVLAIILVVIIPVAIFAPGAGSGSGSGARGFSLSASKRYDMISSKIVESGISVQELLSKGNSPQNKALNWIVAEDPAQLDPDDKFVLPRYSLAVFYFSTHGNEMFQVATINITQTIPPVDEDTDLGVGEEAAKQPVDGETTTMGDDLAAQPNWVHESGWLSGAGYCSWYGVECHHRDGTSIYNTRYDDNNGLVLLNMTENNVRGSIPREVFLANPDIRWFSLGGNGFFGEVPAEIGTLTQMRYLSVANNFFTGSLPNSITQMKGLNRLYVDGNYFAGKLPAGLGGMTSLETLSIYNNFFTGTLTPDLGKMVNMTALYLDINHLSGTIPPEIGGLQLLGDLRLRHNRFTGKIPDSLGDIPDLEILYLDRNTFTGTIPTTLGQATRLTEMHLYRNKLKGSIPTQLGRLKELNSLYLDNNHLTGGIPTEFGDLNTLEQIYLHKNYMNGTIPSEIGKMESLSNFRIYTNGFVGTIPPEMANAYNLENVYLQDNVLSGPVPETIGELTRLQKLRLYWNRFEGAVPKKICDLMEFRLTEFKSDCAGDTPKVQCECCTACFA